MCNKKECRKKTQGRKKEIVKDKDMNQALSCKGSKKKEWLIPLRLLRMKTIVQVLSMFL
jgi:hypothetical protein